MMHYYRYFVDSALERAEHGERRKAVAAILHSMRIFPFRSIKHLFEDTRLRKAVLRLARPDTSAMAAHLPVWLLAEMPDKIIRFGHAITASIPG